MTGTIPDKPKIYHIVHVDRLASIIQSNGLLSDAEVRDTGVTGTTIGMTDIKTRRLEQLTLQSHEGLYVGQCVPFYFCPRSVMLYMFYANNSPELQYDGGQTPILHFEAKLNKVVKWADKQEKKWAFTGTNAGARLFEDRNDLKQLDIINWDIVQARQWSGQANAKAAEFLVEEFFPWELVSKIGVYSQTQQIEVNKILTELDPTHKPKVEIKRAWYY